MICESSSIRCDRRRGKLTSFKSQRSFLHILGQQLQPAKTKVWASNCVLLWQAHDDWPACLLLIAYSSDMPGGRYPLGAGSVFLGSFLGASFSWIVRPYVENWSVKSWKCWGWLLDLLLLRSAMKTRWSHLLIFGLGLCWPFWFLHQQLRAQIS